MALLDANSPDQDERLHICHDFIIYAKHANPQLPWSKRIWPQRLVHFTQVIL